MKRLNNPLLLTHHPWCELIEECNHILFTDQEDHSVQVDFFERLKIQEGQPKAKLEKMERRLLNAELRNDVFFELVNRLGRHDFLYTIAALEKAIAEANYRYGPHGELPTYGLTAQFSGKETKFFIH